MTWPEFVAKVNAALDAMGVTPDAVDIDIIDILGGESSLRVDVVKRANGRFDLIVE